LLHDADAHTLDRVPRFRASKTGNTGGKFSAGEGLKAAVN